jgi:hypothetical protein
MATPSKTITYIDQLYSTYILPSIFNSLREKYGTQPVNNITLDQFVEAVGCSKAASITSSNGSNGSGISVPALGNGPIPPAFASLTPPAPTTEKVKRTTCAYKKDKNTRKCAAKVATDSKHCLEHTKQFGNGMGGGPPPVPTGLTLGPLPGLTPSAIQPPTHPGGPPPIPHFTIPGFSIPGTAPPSQGPPQLPNIPSMPGLIPTMPPSAPVAPQLPAIPPMPISVPAAPPIPAMPQLPSSVHVPAMPQVPATVPAMPHVPAMPQLPSSVQVPAMPQVPHVPVMPQVPATVPAMPQLPSVTQLPSVEVVRKDAESLTNGEILLPNGVVVKPGTNGGHEFTGVKVIGYKLPTEHRVPITQADEQDSTAKWGVIARTPAIPAMPPLPPMPPM